MTRCERATRECQTNNADPKSHRIRSISILTMCPQAKPTSGFRWKKPAVGYWHKPRMMAGNRSNGAKVWCQPPIASRAKWSIDDTMLMEHTANHVALQRAKEINDALRMEKESDPRGLVRAHRSFQGIYASPARCTAHHGGDRHFILDGPRMAGAASFLGLSNEEYARRRVLMTNPVLIKDEYESSYRPAYIRAFY